MMLDVMERTCEIPSCHGKNRIEGEIVQHKFEAFYTLLITPYPTGRVFGGGAVPGTSCPLLSKTDSSKL